MLNICLDNNSQLQKGILMNKLERLLGGLQMISEMMKSAPLMHDFELASLGEVINAIANEMEKEVMKK